MIESAIAFLVTHYATEEDHEDVIACIDCGHCDCTCLDNAEDETRNA